MTENGVTFAWCYGGNTYVSVQPPARSAYPAGYFLCIPGESYAEEPFTDLFGYDGVMISYPADRGDGWSCMFNDYYVFTENPDGSASVSLLARVCGTPYRIDLDGDGTAELVSDLSTSIYYQRDGRIYEADVLMLLSGHLPVQAYYGYDLTDRYATVWIDAAAEGSDGTPVQASAWRRVYFDGENLLVYQPQRDLAGHTMSGVRAPEAVLDAAREAVRKDLEERKSSSASAEEAYRSEWDDYCITRLDPVSPIGTDRLPEGLHMAVYQVGYELHTSTPEKVALAGGVYVNEDGWIGGFGAGSVTYLVFQILEDGTYVYLDSIGDYASPGSPVLAEWVNGILADHGLPQLPIPAV